MICGLKVDPLKPMVFLTVCEFVCVCLCVCGWFRGGQSVSSGPSSRLIPFLAHRDAPHAESLHAANKINCCG